MEITEIRLTVWEKIPDEEQRVILLQIADALEKFDLRIEAKIIEE